MADMSKVEELSRTIEAAVEQRRKLAGQLEEARASVDSITTEKDSILPDAVGGNGDAAKGLEALNKRLWEVEVRVRDLERADSLIEARIAQLQRDRRVAEIEAHLAEKEECMEAAGPLLNAYSERIAEAAEAGREAEDMLIRAYHASQAGGERGDDLWSVIRGLREQLKAFGGRAAVLTEDLTEDVQPSAPMTSMPFEPGDSLEVEKRPA